MKKLIGIAISFLTIGVLTIGVFTAGAFGFAAAAQDFSGSISKGVQPHIAIPDFRGNGNAQKFMPVFNQTLWSDVNGSGLLKMVPKTLYPLAVPQQPADFSSTSTAGQNLGGHAMSDWAGPPTSANYLTFGYTGIQNGVFVLYGWLFDLSQNTPTAAQVLGKTYLGTVDEAGARKTAHEFAADIIAKFGGKSLFGTHIYFVHQAAAGAPKEIWAMDWDGGNQHQLTQFRSLSIEPAVSADGAKIAFVSYAKGTPGIYVFSLNPLRDLHFYNQSASVNSSPTFTPDGKQILYSSSVGGCCRIFVANTDGSGFKPVTHSTFIDTEPKVNPKTGADVVFVSGRSGPQQIYHMNIDGGDIERLSDGTGEASNPSWHPDGQLIAFSWTRGFAAGKFNIFTMDVSTRRYLQLTHDEGKNENPSWAPDGVHLAFASTRNGGRTQIYTMLGDGSQPPAKLTTQGLNFSPIWGK